MAVAVLVNCALIGLSGPVHRLLPDATPAQTILVIVALEVSEELVHPNLEAFSSMHVIISLCVFVSVIPIVSI